MAPYCSHRSQFVKPLILAVGKWKDMLGKRVVSAYFLFLFCFVLNADSLFQRKSQSFCSVNKSPCQCSPSVCDLAWNTGSSEALPFVHTKDNTKARS